MCVATPFSLFFLLFAVASHYTYLITEALYILVTAYIHSYNPGYIMITLSTEKRGRRGHFLSAKRHIQIFSNTLSIKK